MSWRWIVWVILLAVIALGLLMPAYRFYNKHQPIVKLGMDLKGGIEITLQAVPDDQHRPTPDEMQGAISVLRNRLDPKGTKDIGISQVGTDRILVLLPGETDVEPLLAVIAGNTLLEFVATADTPLEPGDDLNQPGSTQRKAEYTKFPTILTGADMSSARVDFNERHQPIIYFQFKPAAADKFSEFTNEHVGQYIAVVMDGKVLTCPVIKAAIWGGKGVIEGGFTIDDASRLVTQINAGALPVPLKVQSSSVVRPKAGAKATK